MPSLASMRSIDPTETHSPLGPPVREVREVPQAAPQPTQTPGIVRMPDGKLATDLPEPSAKPAVRVHDSICFNFEQGNTPRAERKPQVGDLVYILSGQPDHDPINEMVGKTFPIEQVGFDYIRVNDWTFNLPGKKGFGSTLETAYACAKASP